MLILLIGFVPRFVQSISWQLVTSTGKLDKLLRLTIAEATATTLLSIWFVSHWGILGVAIGTAIPMFISNVFVVPVFVLRTFHFSLLEYLRRGLLRPLICALGAFGSALLIVNTLKPSTWAGFGLAVLLTLAVEACILLAVGLEQEDRAQLRQWSSGLTRRWT